MASGLWGQQCQLTGSPAQPRSSPARLRRSLGTGPSVPVSPWSHLPSFPLHLELGWHPLLARGCACWGGLLLWQHCPLLAARGMESAALGHSGCAPARQGGICSLLLSAVLVSLQRCAGTPWECRVGTSPTRTSQPPATGLTPRPPSTDGECGHPPAVATAGAGLAWRDKGDTGLALATNSSSALGSQAGLGGWRWSLVPQDTRGTK